MARVLPADEQQVEQDAAAGPVSAAEAAAAAAAAATAAANAAAVLPGRQGAGVDAGNPWSGGWAMLHRVCMGYATAVNYALLILGYMFVFQAINTGVVMESQGVFRDGLQGCKDSALLLFSVLAVPFFEELALLHDPPAVSVSVLCFWMPSMLALFLIVTFSLGQFSLRFRSAWTVVPFIVLAAVFLTWQVEVGKMLSQLAHEEEFKFGEAQKHLEPAQMVPYQMFKESYETFSAMFDEQQCTSSLSPYSMQLKCSRETVEAKLMQVGTSQFCRSHAVDQASMDDFSNRVQVCLLQGRQLGILPASSKAPSRDSDSAYCRCRSAFDDCLRMVSRWAAVVWMAQFLGVCLVLYFGVEPNLAKMGTKERREILGFAAVGVVGLICRVFLVGDSSWKRLAVRE